MWHIILSCVQFEAAPSSDIPPGILLVDIARYDMLFGWAEVKLF